jgi:predicted DNA-binding protein (UPF0251 family)/predicted Fe-Mo cluster-binding NifX family protein
VPLRLLDEVHLTLEELEALRLKDLEAFDQEQCAAHMNISRPTFQRVLAAGRKKIADALLNGKAVRIEGGHFDMAGMRCKCKCKVKEGNMKIAVVTDDGKTICQHFGRASLYEVFTIQDGKVSGREQRPKMGHSHFAHHGAGHEAHGPGHGFDADSQKKHASMAEAIADCQVLIAGGMGMGALQSLKGFNIEPLLTDKKDIDEAVALYVEGKLPNLTGRGCTK